jgi:hypothetical protein
MHYFVRINIISMHPIPFFIHCFQIHMCLWWRELGCDTIWWFRRHLSVLRFIVVNYKFIVLKGILKNQAISQMQLQTIAHKIRIYMSKLWYLVSVFGKFQIKNIRYTIYTSFHFFPVVKTKYQIYATVSCTLSLSTLLSILYKYCSRVKWSFLRVNDFDYSVFGMKYIFYHTEDLNTYPQLALWGGVSSVLLNSWKVVVHCMDD